jgi:hypothetical protein
MGEIVIDSAAFVNFLSILLSMIFLALYDKVRSILVEVFEIVQLLATWSISLYLDD